MSDIITNPYIATTIEMAGVSPDRDGLFRVKDLQQAGIRVNPDFSINLKDVQRIREEARLWNSRFLSSAASYADAAAHLYDESAGIDFGEGLVASHCDVYELPSEKAIGQDCEGLEGASIGTLADLDRNTTLDRREDSDEPYEEVDLSNPDARDSRE